jgi:hypothetical protein
MRLNFNTIINFHICYGLPFVHCNEPSISLLATAEIYDQLLLFTAKSRENSIKALLGELSIWK